MQHSQLQPCQIVQAIPLPLDLQRLPSHMFLLGQPPSNCCDNANILGGELSQCIHFLQSNQTTGAALRAAHNLLRRRAASHLAALRRQHDPRLRYVRHQEARLLGRSPGERNFTGI